MATVRSRVATASAALALTALTAVGMPGSVAAQDAITAPIPNHIHQGSCAALSDVIVAPLADLSFAAQGATATPAGAMATPVAGVDQATPMASPVAGMMGSALPVAVATTSVPLPLADILAAPHAVNLHDPAAPNDPTRYLACGDLAGEPDEQGNIFVGLGEINGSGFSGVAWLLDGGDGASTTVTVFLSEGAVGAA